jgi:hypothetical protein
MHRYEAYPTSLLALKKIAISSQDLTGIIPALPKDRELEISIVGGEEIIDLSDLIFPPVNLAVLSGLKLKSLSVYQAYITNLDSLSSFEGLGSLYLAYNYETLALRSNF